VRRPADEILHAQSLARGREGFVAGEEMRGMSQRPGRQIGILVHQVLAHQEIERSISCIEPMIIGAAGEGIIAG